MKLYKYGMLHRGFSPGCQPDGVITFEDCIKSKTGFWNYIYYDTPLSEDNVLKYELKYIGEVIWNEI